MLIAEADKNELPEFKRRRTGLEVRMSSPELKGGTGLKLLRMRFQNITFVAKLSYNLTGGSQANPQFNKPKTRTRRTKCTKGLKQRSTSATGELRFSRLSLVSRITTFIKKGKKTKYEFIRCRISCLKRKTRDTSSCLQMLK